MESDPAKSASAPRGAAGVAAAIVALVLAGAGIWLLLRPTIHELYRQMHDDYCPLAASGEPDRNDPDCYGSLGNVILVEEWNREHP